MDYLRNYFKPKKQESPPAPKQIQVFNSAIYDYTHLPNGKLPTPIPIEGDVSIVDKKYVKNGFNGSPIRVVEDESFFMEGSLYSRTGGKRLIGSEDNGRNSFEPIKYKVQLTNGGLIEFTQDEYYFKVVPEPNSSFTAGKRKSKKSNRSIPRMKKYKKNSTRRIKTNK